MYTHILYIYKYHIYLHEYVCVCYALKETILQQWNKGFFPTQTTHFLF